MAEWIEIVELERPTPPIRVSASDGGVDWNFYLVTKEERFHKSSLAMAEWIEIMCYDNYNHEF